MAQRESLLDVDSSRRLAANELPTFVSRQVLSAKRFYFDLNAQTPAAIKIVVGGSERLSGDYAYHRTAFPYSSIEFVAEGKGTLEMAGKHHPLVPGTVFGFGPDTALTIRASRSELMLKYHITFAGQQADELLNTAGFIPCGIKQVADIPEIREIFEQMIRYGTRRTPYSELLCNSLVPTLTYKIAEQSIDSTILNTQSLETYLKLRDLIVNECPTLRNLRAAAERCEISIAYACRLFERYGEQSPHQFLLQQKMKYAADVLTTTQAHVRDVAEQLGYLDPFHFSRVFKRFMGVSPTKFQRRLVALPKRTGRKNLPPR
jgi:AraC-like DNA-binding protein